MSQPGQLINLVVLVETIFNGKNMLGQVNFLFRLFVSWVWLVKTNVSGPNMLGQI